MFFTLTGAAMSHGLAGDSAAHILPSLLRLAVVVTPWALLTSRRGGSDRARIRLRGSATGSLVVGSVLLVRASSHQLWSDPPPAIEISRILTSEDLFAGVLAATVGGALAMLGPGRWSVDARLFGWKRIEASPRRSSSSSH
jgi:hypothetical protein